MAVNYGPLLAELNRAYPKKTLAEAGVDFVRDEDGMPRSQIEANGSVYVTLRSLEWGTECRVLLGRPMTERERAAGPGRAIVSGGMIADRMDRAAAELREAPPFFLGETVES